MVVGVAVLNMSRGPVFDHFMLTCVGTELQSPSSTIQEENQPSTWRPSSQNFHVVELKTPGDTAEEGQSQ